MQHTPEESHVGFHTSPKFLGCSTLLQGKEATITQKFWGTCLARILYCLQKGCDFAPCSELKEGPGMQGLAQGVFTCYCPMSFECFRAGLCVEAAWGPNSLQVIGGASGSQTERVLLL